MSVAGCHCPAPLGAQRRPSTRRVRTTSRSRVPTSPPSGAGRGRARRPSTRQFAETPPDGMTKARNPAGDTLPDAHRERRQYPLSAHGSTAGNPGCGGCRACQRWPVDVTQAHDFAAPAPPHPLQRDKSQEPSNQPSRLTHGSKALARESRACVGAAGLPAILGRAHVRRWRPRP